MKHTLTYQVIEDIKQENSYSKSQFAQSEQNRLDLQSHILASASKIEEDTKAHGAFQDQLIQENEALKKKIEEMEKQRAESELEHQREIQALRRQMEEEKTRGLQEKEEMRQKLQGDVDRMDIIIKSQILYLNICRTGDVNSRAFKYRAASARGAT